ncbi:hypothetical protein pb186bvf_006842 [Paramecium bursaria]
MAALVKPQRKILYVFQLSVWTHYGRNQPIKPLTRKQAKLIGTLNKKLPWQERNSGTKQERVSGCHKVKLPDEVSPPACGILSPGKRQDRKEDQLVQITWLNTLPFKS